MLHLEKTDDSMWQALLDDVAERFGIHTTLSNAEGKILLEGGRYNPLCSRIRATPQSLMAVCSQTSATMTKEARTTRAPCADLCEAGMYKTVVPIFDGDRYLGALSACGVVVEPLEAFLVGKILSLEEDDAERLIAEVPVIGEDVAQRITEAFLDQLAVARREG